MVHLFSTKIFAFYYCPETNTFHRLLLVDSDATPNPVSFITVTETAYTHDFEDALYRKLYELKYCQE